jgi:hypothetical protein
MILLPRSELRFMQGTILALFLSLIATILVGYGARESLRAELRVEIAAQAGKQAVLVLNGATYAVVHNHREGWDVAAEPLDLTPPKNGKGGKGK